LIFPIINSLKIASTRFPHYLLIWYIIYYSPYNILWRPKPENDEDQCQQDALRVYHSSPVTARRRPEWIKIKYNLAGRKDVSVVRDSSISILVIYLIFLLSNAYYITTAKSDGLGFTKYQTPILRFTEPTIMP